MIVVDASVVIKWLKSDEIDSDRARLLYTQHKNKEKNIIVPQLLFFEVANYLSTKSRSSEENIKMALGFLFRLKLAIHGVQDKELIETAKLAKKYKTSVYDMLYAVIAKKHKIILVTADERFMKVTEFPFVKLLSEYSKRTESKN